MGDTIKTVLNCNSKGVCSMDDQNEKSERLQKMLDESLLPVFQQLKNLESDMQKIQDNQAEIKNLLKGKEREG